MRKQKNFLSKKNSIYKISLLTFLFIVISGLIFQPLVSPGTKPIIELFMAASISIVLIVWGVFIIFKKISYSEAMLLVFIIGVIIRLGYILYTDSLTRQHDVYDANGHFSYIMQLALNNKLPEINTWQLYHPPLYHFLASLIVKVLMFFGVTDKYQLGDILQFFTACCSCGIMLITWKIFDKLKLNDLPKIIGFSIICFHPTFFILAGSVNNDCLCNFLMFLCIYYTIKWYNSPTALNIAVIAVSFGLAMMTKISAIMIAVPIAFIFIYKFVKIEDIIDKVQHKAEIICKYLLFLIIALPLSLWYPVRNLIKFGQSFSYIPMLNINSQIYCGNVPLIDRLNPFNLNLINDTFCNVNEDYNIMDYILKCSIFGEWNLSVFEAGSFTLLILNVLMVLISLVCMVYAMIKIKDKYLKILNIFLFILWITQIISFVSTNMHYQFACTMDFRYIVLTLLTGVVYISETLHILKNKVISSVIITICILFCINSAVVYTMLK